jgi:phosphotriesterase-related protein
MSGMDQVMTVTGPVAASSLGMTLTHEHLFINLMREYRGDGLLHDEKLMCEEVQRFARAGGATIIDCTTEELGRNPEGLKRISEATGIKIVMGTGHYRDPYLDRAWFDRTRVSEIADLMIAEITQGIDGTAIKAGIIGEIGADKWFVSAVEELSFRAAALTQKRTGLTITTHAARWPVGRDQLRILVESGAEASRVIIGHCDTVPDTDYHEEIARGGSYVQFDCIQGESAYQTERVTSYILNLIRKGFGDRVLLSHDVCLTSNLSVNGGCGYDYIPAHFLPLLKEKGLSPEDIEMLVVENPRRALTGAR